MGRWRWTCAVLALVLVAGACGDDDDDEAQEGASVGETTAAPDTSADDVATTAGGDEGQDTVETSDTVADEGEPVPGGELEVLFQSERRALDPVTATPSAASTGLTDFALYGALVGYDAATSEVRPILAESLESNDTFDVWTLRLRPGLVFSDGSPYDADAVKVNWERGQDPANRSSAFAVLQLVSEMVVVDATTLEIHLVEPNAVFDRTVSKYNINYIASAAAIRAGQDLTSAPVGAGPFVLESWTRDDRMVLVRNPDWYDAPRPYLERLVVRVVPDEQQRVDTFSVGDADAMYTAVSESIATLEDDGFAYTSVPLSHSSVMMTNATRPPFDDVAMRRFLFEAIDFQAMLEIVDGPDAEATTTFSVEGAPWSSDATVPEYDPEHAQELLDEYTAANGPLDIACLAGQSPRQQTMCEFAQTSLNQMDGIEASIEVLDTPTFIQRAYSHDFDFGVWGFPTTYPDPGLYLGVQSTSSANPMGFSNPEVDALFAEARQSGDADARAEVYRQIYDLFADELPFRPLEHATYGYAYADDVHGIEFYEDGIIRTDRVWVDG
jgi:peptide/nickel transport system substrate-binding protein